MSAKLVWALSIGFLSGVLIRSFVEVSWPLAVFLVLFAIAACCLYVLRPQTWALIAGVAVCACALGILRMDAAAIPPEPELATRVDSHVILVGTVFDEPDVRERNVRLRIRAHELLVASTSVPIQASVLAVVPLHTEVAYGDVVRAEGTLQVPEEFDTGSGRVFDYPMFLAKDGITYQLSFAEAQVIESGGGNVFKRFAIAIKHTYLDGLRSVLPEPAAGLAGGITVGDKRSIGEELSQSFQQTSLIHIVVLSGYNMTVVIHAASRAFTFVPRHGQLALSGCIVALFILMTGGAASATRAGAMALVASYARLSGRSYLALRVLVIVAAGMTLWNPYLPAFDPGFQLSIIATLGLILFTPIIAESLAFISERFQLREIVASTLGTQIAVLPLLLYQNGLLSFVAIPANLLALVFVPASMLASFVAAVAGVVFGVWGTVFALPALLLLKYIIAVAEILSSIPLAHVTIPAFGAWVVVLAYILMGVGYAYIQKKTPGE